MRWSIVGNILLLAFTTAVAQTYIIKFRSADADTASVQTLFQNSADTRSAKAIQSLGLTVTPLAAQRRSVTSTFPWQQYAVIRALNDIPKSIITSIATNPAVEYIQQSAVYSVYSSPNDSAFNSQWNLHRTGVASLWKNGTIDRSLPAVRVGVIDTGIDDKHPDLKDAVYMNPGESGGGKEQNGIDDDGNGFVDDWKGYDFVEQETEDAGDWNIRDNDPSDENGHGTSVSGIIGADANNGIGLTGIFPAAIVPLRAFGKNGNGNDIDIAAAIIYAADNGVDVINMSFGDIVRSSFLNDAVRYAYAKNVVLTASSGNDGSDGPHYPSDFPEVISTGSVGQYDNRSFFSSHSPSLDIMAPGEQIITAAMGGGYTDQFAGTSAASPHTAGIAALIISLDKKRSLTDPAHHRLTNEEVKGILINSADDAGEPGWDGLYGAGVINAQTAVQSVSGSVIKIHSPGLDEQLSGPVTPIIVTALSPYLSSVSLSVNSVASPEQWNELYSTTNIQYRKDTLLLWNCSAYAPGMYTLRLSVKNSKGQGQEFRQRIYIDASLPKIASFRLRDSVIVGDSYGVLVEARTDRNTSGTLFYRSQGSTSYHSIRSAGVQKNHLFILTDKELNPLTPYEMYCEFSENASVPRTVRFPTTVLAGREHFDLLLSDRRIQTTGFSKKPFSLPSGFLLNSVVQVQGIASIIMNQYDSNNDFGPLKAFRFSGNNFIQSDSSERSWVPRAFTKQGPGSSPIVLVQEHGISRLFSVDTLSGTFFQQTLWGDSTDVWASTVADLDMDGTKEIIARSSSEYLVYQKEINGTYSIVSRLKNPSAPLFGDARNQFGPPKSIVGDFSGTGKNEIIVADYDGDILLYRQSSPTAVDFPLVGIDSSDLYEMSDFITAGDFTGDGIMDFAVAGHTNADWNNDREYDAPVWTVRVFSHTASDAPGTVSEIWKQYFVGVKAGSGYDNGLSAGKLRTSDLQDALFLSLNPSLYIFEWDPLKKTFRSRWQHSSQTNTALLYDFDGDGMTDIGFHTDGRTEFWSLPSASVPDVPYAVKGTAVSAAAVRLTWNSAGSIHNIYRGIRPDSLQRVAVLSNVQSYRDTLLTEGTTYYYSVSTVSGTEGGRSAVVSVTPHSAATITGVHPVSSSQISVDLSFDLLSGNVQSMQFLLDSVHRSSTVVWKSERSLSVSFGHSLKPGIHSLSIRHLIDAEGMPGDTSAVFVFTVTDVVPDDFIVRTAELTSPNRITLRFSEPIRFATAKSPTNFSIRSVVRSFAVGSVDSLDASSVAVTLPGTDLKRIAVRIEVAVGDAVASQSGKLLNGGKGQVVSIAQETASLNNIVVYPNPARQQHISFVNLPANCRITIYSAAGDKMVTLSEPTSREGLTWNLMTSAGNLVSTGIYLYRIEQLNDAQEPMGSITGKFAVIR
jgi:subtilisin family serine protease